jgi:methyl-accepting chemotaxis protein
MSERRKTLLINAAQQRRLIMGTMLGAILLINSLLVLALLFKPALLNFVELGQTLALAALEALIVAGIGYFSLVFSHRIVGPAYALARDLKRLGKGDLTVRTQLRKGDFHTEVAEAFNLSVENLGSRIKTVKAAVTILEQQPDTPADTRQALQALLRDLGYFKTEPSLHDSPRSDAAPNRAVLTMDKPSSLAR